MTTFADKAIAYYHSLTAPTTLPPGIGVMNPYEQPSVRPIVEQFYAKFYADNRPRVFVLGINPGRFGAGVTGISFTTPQNLRRYCGIDNELRDTPELSSRFVYQVVEAFGGAAEFYGRFFLTSLFPLALTKARPGGGVVNYNFYDDKQTTAALWPAITETVQTQLTFGADRRVAVCLGRKNETYLKRLNEQQGFFDRIVTLDHPRYILQYKSKALPDYLEQYISTLHDCLESA
ncbi:uracil-DNA glycosylase family protein [Spirosoma rhododendri]|uniref:SMUG2 DNA glycosylase family protein n=1 Tax=Spirosoma rhododendri TaxID=2728024 RepID=A0A7L5DRB6_9BACT|nr:uracil-DNA glycosylase family protein [Spirosoma rhododendri]QJD80966.1 SMUG2 DNA glycosylase family protein [Spirosoma rhododendri]